MSDDPWRRVREFLPRPETIGAYLLTGLLTFYSARALINYLLESQPNKEVSRRLEGVLADRARERHKELTAGGEKELPPPDATAILNLTSYEQQIAAEVVHPSEIPITFSDIGGLDAIITDLQESVIYPLTLPHLYSHSSSLLTAPTGVLLYGPPGCGKTMLAKALAHESSACFINLHISTLTEKWYGDSNKLVSAVFSLARKLEPAIVFIDEIDAVLGNRRSGEHEASGMIKAEMMTHMDGLMSANRGTRDPQRIVILGATNRIQDIDDAILRRMPKRFAIGLPDAEQRRRIFNLLLRDTQIDGGKDADGENPQFDLEYLVRVSHGMSGSDIKEACREAAMVPVREFIQKRRAAGETLRSAPPKDLRGVRTEDFFKKVTNSKTAATRSSQNNLEPEDDDYETTDESLSDEEEQQERRT